ncbi:MAG: glutathione peroxidase [Burkholderiaceae bacterium]
MSFGTPFAFPLRTLAYAIVATLLAATLAHAPARAASDCPPLLAHSAPRLQDETPQSLCQYAGRVLLVVNTASFCGYTSQYEGLEALHARYSPRGLVVLGFPSNDFNQEPADNKSIADFCFNTYGVKFPMFAKTSVAGQTAHPFFAALARASGQAPRWNFHKYLVDRDGKVVASFPSAVAPLDRRIRERIEQLLARGPAGNR